MKTSTQLKAQICNLANEKNIEVQVILRNYNLDMIETNQMILLVDNQT